MNVWLVIIPQIAISHEFLMHGLLAVSALHLSILQPSRRKELLKFASKSESLALPIYRELVKRRDPGDISAVFAFAGFIIPYMLTMSGVLGVSSTEIPSLQRPHWFLMARGLVHLLLENWMAIERGPFASVVESTRLPVETFWNPDDHHLADMQGRWEEMCRNSAVVDEGLNQCIKTLEHLRKVLCLPFVPDQSLSIMSAVYYWPGTVSPEYMQLVYERRPEALVVLAHYCVLLKQADWVWFLRGVGEKLLITIEQELGLNWKPWIKWPLEQPCK